MIIVVLIGGIATLAVIIGFTGQGNIRQVEIFWPEKVEHTVIFEDIDGRGQIRAIKGVESDVNPHYYHVHHLHTY